MKERDIQEEKTLEEEFQRGKWKLKKRIKKEKERQIDRCAFTINGKAK